ncbi:MAG: HDOD domain-containing protein [Actinobacteria bacterium]|nr:HDOD domain-containing protein [Actinomycetota bacterium]
MDTSSPAAITDAHGSAIGARAAEQAHIVFVDDEAMVLSGLRRSLSRLRRDWTTEFLEFPEQALTSIRERAEAGRPVDVVVSDFRMPGMDGLELLESIQRCSPSTARVILSGQADADVLLSSMRPSHMFVSKPCDTDALVRVLDRLLRVRALVEDEDLRARLGGASALPKAPEIYLALQRLSRDPAASAADVVAVIEQDVALTAELLKLTNSAFFGLNQPVTSPERAVGLLGLDLVQGLAASGALFSPVDADASIDVARVRQVALRSTSIVRQIARAGDWERDETSDAALAAMLHDIGHLALATGPARAGGGATPEAAPAPACSVARASALLLATWGFSAGVVDLLLDCDLDGDLAEGSGRGAGMAGRTGPQMRSRSAAALQFARAYVTDVAATTTGSGDSAQAGAPDVPQEWWAVAAAVHDASTDAAR